MRQLWRKFMNWLFASEQADTEVTRLEPYSGAIINPKVTSSNTQVIVPMQFKFTPDEVQSIAYREPIINVQPARLITRGGNK